MLLPASFLLRRQTSAFRKPCPRTDNPVAVKADVMADVKADAKADARTMNVVLLLVAASMPDSVVLRRRADSVVLARPLAALHRRAASAAASAEVSAVASAADSAEVSAAVCLVATSRPTAPSRWKALPSSTGTSSNELI